MSTQRQFDGADGARTNHGALARREYGLMVPVESTGDPAVLEPQGSGYSSEDTMGTEGTDGKDTGKGERNGQCVLIAHG